MSRFSSKLKITMLGSVVAAATGSAALAQGVINQPRLSAHLANQVVGDTVTWQLRGRGDDRRRGRAVARVDGSGITGLRLVGG